MLSDEKCMYHQVSRIFLLFILAYLHPSASYPLQTDVKPTILSVQEPTVCKYVVRICVPDLCQKPSPSPTPSHNEVKRAPSGKGGEVSYFYGLWWDQLVGNRDPEVLWMEDLGWANTIQI